MVCDVYFSFAETLLKGLCAYTVFFKKSEELCFYA